MPPRSAATGNINADVGFPYEMLLLKDLNIKKTEDMSVGDYFTKINDLNRQIKSCLNINFDDRLLAGIAVTGLPKSYELMIVRLDKEKLSLSYVKTQMRQEELKRGKETNEEEAESSKALVTRRYQGSREDKKGYYKPPQPMQSFSNQQDQRDVATNQRE